MAGEIAILVKIAQNLQFLTAPHRSNLSIFYKNVFWWGRNDIPFHIDGQMYRIWRITHVQAYGVLEGQAKW